jgi:FMN phosphatase YigB (HAD superfamily)
MNSPIVVFDLGKTLVDFDYSIAAKRIVPHCKPPADPVKFFSEHAAVLTDYELGILTTEQFFTRICSASGFSGTQAEFGNFFADIFTPIQPMIDLHAELRWKKIATYIFSNTNDLAVDHIRKKFPFYTGFDGYILSYEHGCMKPSARLYEIVERTSDRRGVEIVYIDDRPENVDAGSVRGWNTILHEEPEKTREALQKFGVLNHS